MIDSNGVVKIIDFGAVRVAGLAESTGLTQRERGEEILGTEQYTAPEYFIGDGGSPRSDLFSLGVIAYQMLSGRLPYGTDAARVRSRKALAKLEYRSVLDADREIPGWIDGVLQKAVHPDPIKRQDELSEFVHDLRHPRGDGRARGRTPLFDRNPSLFWKGLSLVLLIVVLVLVHQLTGKS
jgi:serine/threonine protein kinase